MKFRAGVFGTTNVVLGAIFLPVFTGFVVVCGLQVSRGTDVGWSCLGGVVALLGCVVMAGELLAGVSTWRSVVLSPTCLSLPGFTLRRGFYRDEVPLTQITDVALRYRSEPRNGRWQLRVVRRGASTLACDSISSSRVSARAPGTSAMRTVERLRAAIADAREEPLP